MDRKIICIILIRDGSKRLPKKNVIQFHGKPTIDYSIEDAIQANLFDRIIVSTDEHFGAEIHLRPPELATDTARVVDVCVHFLDEEGKAGRIYDILCCLYATAPLRTSEVIKNTLWLLEDENCDSAMAVTDYHFPPH